jgi:hypothetical protein
MSLAGSRVRQVSGHRGEPALRVPQVKQGTRDLSVGAIVGPPGGVIGRIWPAVVVVVPIVSEPGPEPTEAMAVTIMAATAVMERKATPHLSARRSPKAPCAHSAEVAAHSPEVASSEAARVAAAAEAAPMAAPSEPAASVAAAPAASAASAASTGVRSCCNGASGERASEQNDHHLFQHFHFLS